MLKTVSWTKARKKGMSFWKNTRESDVVSVPVDT